jgi:hypothetical protein
MPLPVTPASLPLPSASQVWGKVKPALISALAEADQLADE